MQPYIRLIISFVIGIVAGLHAVYAAPPVALTGSNRPAPIEVQK